MTKCKLCTAWYPAWVVQTRDLGRSLRVRNILTDVELVVIGLKRQSFERVPAACFQDVAILRTGCQAKQSLQHPVASMNSDGANETKADATISRHNFECERQQLGVVRVLSRHVQSPNIGAHGSALNSGSAPLSLKQASRIRVGYLQRT